MGSSLRRDAALAVALVASALIQLEVMATRIFSVQLFYHFSFFAVSIAMAGLALGGIWAARWPAHAWSDPEARSRLAAAALLMALAIVLLPAALSVSPPLVSVIAFLPATITAGAFLGAAFSWGRQWIGRLYAADLIAAAGGCLLAIPVMRVVQGTPMLVVPGLLAAVAALALQPPSRQLRSGGAAVVLFAALATGFAVVRPGVLWTLPTRGSVPALERWNDFSRVAVYPTERPDEFTLIIDRSAATTIRLGARAEDPANPIKSSAAAYTLARPLKNVAVIGVGGGIDLYLPLGLGAAVDAYEINPIMFHLASGALGRQAAYWNRPGLRLLPAEGRTGIAHSGKRYDVIQASMIDTWAATAAGGFVLSENGLYTLEGWDAFLSALSPHGVLTMTRWLVPTDPAEVQRLAVLAASALERRGVRNVAEHIVMVADSPRENVDISAATILVSMSPFTADEVQQVAARVAYWGGNVLVAPGVQGDERIERLLDSRMRWPLVRSSAYDLTPPTDARPYFFLQARLADVVSGRIAEGWLRHIFFGGVRVLLLVTLCSLLLMLLVLTTAFLAHRKARQRHGRSFAFLALYFAAIGIGYMLVQLGLHQRLMLILGRPTLALAVILSSMLLGTGLGAWLSARVPDSRIALAWAGIAGTVLLLVLLYPAAGALQGLSSDFGRSLAAGTLVGAVGIALGFAFPAGVRLASSSAPDAVQLMWAINGAASICGSALAAFIGLLSGSRAVLEGALVAYVFAAGAGLLIIRLKGGGFFATESAARAPGEAVVSGEHA